MEINLPKDNLTEGSDIQEPVTHSEFRKGKQAQKETSLRKDPLNPTMTAGNGFDQGYICKHQPKISHSGQVRNPKRV